MQANSSSSKTAVQSGFIQNVKANFYIPDENGTLTPVNGDSEPQNVDKGKFVSFTIPDKQALCSVYME